MSSDPILRPALMKLERAKHHINILNRATQSYFAQKPVRLVARMNRQSETETFSVEQHQPIPDDFSLIIGDAIHNIRTSLDLVVFGMIGSIADRPDSVQFPFAKRAETLVNTIKNRQTDRAGANVVTEIERLEPYPDGNTGIYEIYRLDVIDKHKLIIPTASTVVVGSDEFERMIGLELSTGPGVVPVILSPNTTIEIVNRPFHNSAEKASYFARHLAEYECDISSVVELRFAEDEGLGGPPVIPCLVAMHDLAFHAVHAIVSAYRTTNPL